MSNARAVCVADDRTGAGDAGDRFAERGYRTVVGPVGTEAEVAVVDTDSRYAAPEVAAERVRDAVAAYPEALVYKKVDSTLRGNVATEAAAALDASGAALALVAPAFPAAGRTTVEGTHLVDGTPVAASAAGADPTRPAATSSLPELLADAGPVAHVDLETVVEGPGAVRDALDAAADAEDAPLVACDATRGEHLETLAAGATRLDESVCYVGSAGLAGHVRIGASGPTVGVVGSVASESLAGVAALDCVVELDAPALFGEGEPISATAHRLADRLDAGEDAVLTAARESGDVRATLDAGRESGYTDEEVRNAVGDALARCARGAVERAAAEPSGLFLAGGETAKRTLDELGADGVELAGRPVEAGVPLGHVRGGLLGGAPVVTKAGAFGDRETILRCLGALSRHDGR